VLTIDDPPERPICTACMSPLVLVLPARTLRWLAMVADDNETLRIHRCDVRRGQTDPWEPNPEAAARGRRHMAEIRQVMGWGPNRFIDEEKSA